MGLIEASFQAVTDAIPVGAFSRAGRRSVLRRLWWHSFELLQPRGRLRVPVGRCRLWVDTADAMIGRNLMKHGVFEPRETAIIRALLHPGDVFVDCGANLGYYSFAAAEVLDRQGLVHAFEPVPANCELFAASIADNRLEDVIKLHREALGDRSGEAEIYLDRGNAGAHSFRRANVESEAGSLRVPLRRMDDALAGSRIDVVKIDTQGSERSILAGGEGLIRKYLPVIVTEWWPWGAGDDGGPKAIASMLAGWGYAAALDSGDAGKPLEIISWEELLRRYKRADRTIAPIIICTARRSFHDILPAFFPAR